MQDAYPGVLGGLLSTTLHTPYLAEIWKSLCLDPSLLCASFTTAVPSTVITFTYTRASISLQRRLLVISVFKALQKHQVKARFWLGRLKMREWKNREQIAGVENAGVD